MFHKLKAGYEVLQRGKEVSDPALWKAGQITGNAVGGLILALVALAGAFGYELPVDNEDALIIGGAIVSIFNIVLTMVTTKKIGLRAKGSASIEERSRDIDYPPG
jgi:hypothetical protein